MIHEKGLYQKSGSNVSILTSKKRPSNFNVNYSRNGLDNSKYIKLQ